jgi:hypothetical protein
MHSPSIRDSWCITEIGDPAQFMRFILSQVPSGSVWLAGVAWNKDARKELAAIAVPSPKPFWRRLVDALSGNQDGPYLSVTSDTLPVLHDLLDRGICSQLMVQHVFFGPWKEDSSYWLVSCDFLDPGCTWVSKRISGEAMRTGAQKYGFKFEDEPGTTERVVTK